MSGTVWLRLATTQENIQLFINSLVSQLHTVEVRYLMLTFSSPVVLRFGFHVIHGSCIRPCIP